MSIYSYELGYENISPMSSTLMEISSSRMNVENYFSSFVSKSFSNFYLYRSCTVKYDEAVESSPKDQFYDDVDENMLMKALDGFLIILSKDGDVIYVSENIHEYIGINQVGTSLSDFEKISTITKPFLFTA